MSARFRLRRPDGKIFLERWGWECKWFGVFIHHMQGPDPGRDLHNHPWWFGSFILRGGYIERRASTMTPTQWDQRLRPPWSWGTTRLDQCHTISALAAETWTLVIHGPRRGTWGFYRPEGWVEWVDYDGAGQTDVGRVD